MSKAGRIITELLQPEKAMDKGDLDRQLADRFINKGIDNKKGITLEKRFSDVLSDPSNLFIERSQNAGKIIGDNVVLHNDILVSKNGYYGQFSEIL
jgi:hypothetical protein